ncbi:MAG: type IV secretion system DNA-binding domain-containing protein [Alphaproteobacteria bacterium]|uniref:Type IV secretion system DNA-binding domain-containing protein n=1 Tax=Candidatus Nitrobium versatile TaxID=2884831 RepID=A0A953J9Z9_9BACT|nr:type IV secretion system DNA-binding domain-containing protein [Candidatus Nitrobium versatile]
MSDHTRPTLSESLSMLFDSLKRGIRSYFILFLICFGLHLVLILAANIYFLKDNYWNVCKYLWVHFTNIQSPDWELVRAYMDETIIRPNLAIVKWTSLVWVMGIASFVGFSRMYSRKIAATKVVRGPVLKTEEELVEDVKESKAKVDIMLTKKLGIPVYIETGHIGVVGATGTGKTQTINRIIPGLIKRQNRMIVHELKGNFFSTFSNDRDLLFCPFDQRHMNKYGGWSIFSSIRTEYDIETVACALIPDQPFARDAFWYVAPRQLLTSILRYCFFTGRTKNRDIWDTLNLSRDDMIKCLKGIPGAEIGLSHIIDKTKAASDVKSVLLSYVQSIQYLSDSDGDFVIEDWLKHGDGSIYILNYPKIKSAMAPVLSLFMELLIKSVNSLDADLHRRIAFIIDEAPQLQKLNSLIDLLTLSRDRGAMNLLAWQTNSQWRKLYGREDAETILGNLKSKIVCQLADVDTCKYFAENFGEVEELRTLKTTSVAGNHNKESEGHVSYSEHIHKRDAVSKEDLKRLKVTAESYEAIVKFANYDAAKIKFPIIRYPKRVREFQPKPGVDLDYIKIKWEKLQTEAETIIGEKGKEAEHDQERCYSHFE